MENINIIETENGETKMPDLSAAEPKDWADAIVALLGISGVSFASIVCRVMELICCYKTFCDFEPEYSVLYLILSILGLEWIALFLCRRNVPVGIAGHCHPRQPRYNEE